MSFIELIYRNTGKNYSNAASPKPTTAWMTTHKIWDLEPTAQPAGFSTGWTSFAVSLRLFQAA